MPQYIGFDLPRCVLEIVEGKVKLDQVVCVVADTTARTDIHWREVIREYCERHWPESTRSGGQRDGHKPLRSECMETLMMLRASGRVVQPRLAGVVAPPSEDGAWIEL